MSEKPEMEEQGANTSLLPRSQSLSLNPGKGGSGASASVGEYPGKSNTWRKSGPLQHNPSQIRFAADPTRIKSEIPEDPTLRDDAGSTPLHWATIHGQIEKTIQLLKKGASVHAKNNAGYTPLHCAAEFGNVRLVHILFEHGADPKMLTATGHTALHCAARWGHLSVMEVLIEQYKFDVNSQDQNGWSPLHFAAFHGFDELVKFLCANGANFSLTTKRGETPIHGASVNGHEKCVGLLLGVGSNVNSTDSWGGTPLHYSSYNGHDKTAKLLISHGADPTIRDSSGRTPSDVASKNCADVLREAERRLHTQSTRTRAISEDSTIILQIHFEATSRKTKVTLDISYEALISNIESLFSIRCSFKVYYIDEEHGYGHPSPMKHDQQQPVIYFNARSTIHSNLVLISGDEDLKIAMGEFRKKKNKRVKIFVEEEKNHIPFICMVTNTPFASTIFTNPSNEKHTILEHRLVRVSPKATYQEFRNLLESRLKCSPTHVYFRVQDFLVTVDSDQDWREVITELHLDQSRPKSTSPFTDSQSLVDVHTHFGSLSMPSQGRPLLYVVIPSVVEPAAHNAEPRSDL